MYETPHSSMIRSIQFEFDIPGNILWFSGTIGIHMCGCVI